MRLNQNCRVILRKNLEIKMAIEIRRVMAESRFAQSSAAYNDQVKHGYNPNYANPQTRRMRYFFRRFGMKKTILAIVGIGLILISGCAAPASTPTPVLTTALPKPTATSIPLSETATPELSELRLLDIPYVPEGSSRQMLDVYLPANGDGPFPTILAIHGGGFNSRSKDLYSRLAVHLNELGYAVV